MQQRPLRALQFQMVSFLPSFLPRMRGDSPKNPFSILFRSVLDCQEGYPLPPLFFLRLCRLLILQSKKKKLRADFNACQTKQIVPHVHRHMTFSDREEERREQFRRAQGRKQGIWRCQNRLVDRGDEHFLLSNLCVRVCIYI
jgi:hypothetical protein